MSSPEFIRCRQRIQAVVADSSNNQAIDECINAAQRDVARAFKWPELVGRSFFNTEAAYSTGTVAVTNGDATVTLTGGTFPTTVAPTSINLQGMRFAVSVGSPWYPVRTRTDATHVELASVYIDDTDTSTAFIVYKSHYSMPSNVDRVDEMWLHTSGAVPLESAATDQKVTEFSHYPSGPGVPTHFLPIERDVHGNHQIVLGPMTPDDVYRVEYTFRRRVVDNQFAGNLDDSRWPMIEALAKSMAYESEFYDRSVTEMQRYEKLLAKAIAQGDEVETTHVRVGQNRVDYPRRGRRIDGLSIIGP